MSRGRYGWTPAMDKNRKQPNHPGGWRAWSVTEEVGMGFVTKGADPAASRLFYENVLGIPYKPKDPEQTFYLGKPVHKGEPPERLFEVRICGCTLVGLPKGFAVVLCTKHHTMCQQLTSRHAGYVIHVNPTNCPGVPCFWCRVGQNNILHPCPYHEKEIEWIVTQK